MKLAKLASTFLEEDTCKHFIGNMVTNLKITLFCFSQNNWQGYLEKLSEILQCLRESGLTARPSKMSIGFKEIEFLGHVVGSGEQRPEQKKVEKVLKLKPPRTKREVKSLLGFLNYYRKFVPNFSELSTPLSDLTKKGKPDKVTWTEECEDALKKIQDVFSSEPVLKLPDLNKPFLVRTDASSHGIGAVLMQEHDGYIMPCLYASRKLLPREQNYAVIEKECLAIIFGVSTFSRYLLLSEFIIETDHKPLAYLKVSKAKNSRLMRWSLILQQYCFHIRPISGGINHQADVLSRLV